MPFWIGRAGSEAGGITETRDYSRRGWSAPSHNVPWPTSSRARSTLFSARDVSELDEYLRIVNLALDLPPFHALDAVEELLEHAASDDDIALVGALALEPVVELH